jgi:hypothetical protein
VILMPNYINLDYDKLVQYYCIEGKSATTIASILGCNPSTVYSRLLEYGLREKKTENKMTIEKDILQELYYTEKMSYKAIGEAIGCDAQTICLRMKEYDLKANPYSETSKNTIRTPLWRSRIAAKSRLHKHDEKTKQFLSKQRKEKYESGELVPYGKGLTKLTNPDIIKTGVSGEKHWNYKGGTSSEYFKEAMSPEYKLWRKQVLERDNYTCQDCGATPEKNSHLIHAHHVKPYDEYPELKFVVSNGKTVCAKCHAKYRRLGDDT